MSPCFMTEAHTILKRPLKLGDEGRKTNCFLGGAGGNKKTQAVGGKITSWLFNEEQTNDISTYNTGQHYILWIRLGNLTQPNKQNEPQEHSTHWKCRHTNGENQQQLVRPVVFSTEKSNQQPQSTIHKTNLTLSPLWSTTARSPHRWVGRRVCEQICWHDKESIMNK